MTGESYRLAALRRYEVLDTPPDGTFDRITRLAAQLFEVPIALVSLVDEDRIWFKSRHGLDAVTEVPKEPGLCASAVVSEDLYMVEDALSDPRTLLNSLVTGEFGLRFYAAAALVTSDGQRLGTLCVIDHRPRTLTPPQQGVLVELAAVVMDEMELRLRTIQRVRMERARQTEAEAHRRAAEAVAGALRESLLPPRLPKIEGVALAAAYRPAAVDEVGGDFYDVFQVADGSWFLTMGDVCGKGPKAAAVTAAARYGLRAVAVHQRDPAEVLAALNRVLLSEPQGDVPEHWCTLAVARLEVGPRGVELQLASGGHPSPRVVRASGSVANVEAPGMIVGALPDASFATTSYHLDPGDTLVFFTDGVTEARVGSELFGHHRLDAALKAARRGSPAQLLDDVLSAISGSGAVQRDDIAVLVATVEPPGGSRAQASVS